MAQNIYDKPEFFEGYSQLSRSLHGLDGAAEWESIQTVLPALSGKRVVDLGCGFGWFARYAAGQGARSVLGFDISERMIDRAKRETVDSTVRYEIADLETFELPPASFDLAYSSLAFHYIEDFSRLAATIHSALVSGSDFVFTIEHPIYMAPANPGWTADREGRRIWPLDGYSREGKRTTDWLAKGVVKYHRTLGTTLNTLIANGFSIRHVEEWRPGDEQLRDHPEWAEEMDRPMFLLIAVQR